MSLNPGIYEALLDEGLKEVLARHAELRSVFGKLDPEEEPNRLAAFVSRVLEKALRLFARDVKKHNGLAVPFAYLGPATRVSYQNERPIQIVWRLTHFMPAEMFEENRRGA